MRRTVGIAVAVAGAVLVALILGEYELVGVVPLVAGVVVGLLLGEAVVGIARWRGGAAAAVAAALAAGSLAWAGWIDSSQGLEPYPALAAVGAVLAAAVAGVRAWGGRAAQRA